MRVSFGEPNSGGLTVELSDDETGVSFFASYVYACLETLVKALYLVLVADGMETVVWFAEPIEYEMRFARKGDIVSLTVLEYPDHLRPMGGGTQLLYLSGNYQQIALPFWRALRGIQGRCSSKEWEREWGRPFPVEDMSKWTVALVEQGVVA